MKWVKRFAAGALGGGTVPCAAVRGAAGARSMRER